MKVNGIPHRTIWVEPSDPKTIRVIDQRVLPHRFEVLNITTVAQMVVAIKEMIVRGAPLIGVAAAYGMYLAAVEGADMERAAAELRASRPTAVNLAWAVAEQEKILQGGVPGDDVAVKLLANAERIADADIAACRAIGDYGLEIIREIAKRRGDAQPVQILTHCNAGWLCAVDWGTATAPMYRAFDEGIPIHVWVDETRPRNQGASLTAWELGQHGVPYTLITDNAGGHLMQRGKVDMVITGTDRVTRGGDVANKIGTYLKALAAQANSVPFYVAAPISSIDFSIESGDDIPIEERSEDEVKYVQGLCDGEVKSVLISPESARAANFGFDVTPRHLVTALITESGIVRGEGEILKIRPANFAQPSSLRESPLPDSDTRDEGVIKFQCRFQPSSLPQTPALAELIRFRDLLFDLNLIGVYPDGIGFGNISVRGANGMLISASQTGHIARTTAQHYSRVTKYSISENSLECVGDMRASSESLTHAMIYEVFPTANAVVHVHNHDHWRKLLHNVPTTAADVPYGTPAMAHEIRRLADTARLGDIRVLAMAGHEDGILGFGATLADAVTTLCEKLGLPSISLV